MSLQGRTVLVTGGASGLGGATVDMVVAAGGRAVILDLNDEKGRAKAVAAGRHRSFRTGRGALREGRRHARGRRAAAVDTATREFGQLDGLVNAAGIPAAERVLGEKACSRSSTSRASIQINLVGTFNVIRLAAAAMAKNTPSAGGERGVIVNTASVAAFDGQIGQAAYSASKGGIVGDDAADRPRVRADRHPRHDHRAGHVRHAAAGRAARGGARIARAAGAVSRRGSAGPRNTRRSCATSSRTRC